MIRTLQRLAPLLALAGLATASPEAAAQTVCVYDPAGRTGFAYGWLQKWQEASAGWGGNRRAEELQRRRDRRQRLRQRRL
jgi:hypothetical protein